MPYDITTRAQAITLKLLNLSNQEIEAITGISGRTVNKFFDKAIARGLDPTARPLRILTHHVEDGERSGRPTKRTPENIEAIISQVKTDRYGREKTCAAIADEFEVSEQTVWRVLHAAGFTKTKPTRKPGLTVRMRALRLQFCLDHQHWTLEDWKRVIWSDETSMVLGHRRGGYRVWRLPSEALLKSTIRERWAGYQEFMFWGCFSWDSKGPCYIWEKETAQEKKQADEAIATLNAEIEPILKEQWELSTGIQRLGLRNKGGRKPTWKFTAKTGKLIRLGKGGIDWWRYRKHILEPLLLPYAKECQITRLDTLVQEDNAPAHAHSAQQQVYDMWEVQRLVWCPNSPDLNMIEPAWWYLKHKVTAKGAPTSRSDAKRRWKEAWEELPQSRIQGWIERIVHHIKEVIRCEGGNEYKEGRPESTLLYNEMRRIKRQQAREARKAREAVAALVTTPED